MAFEAYTGISGDLVTKSWIASKKAYEIEYYHIEETDSIVFFAFRPSFSADDWFAPANKSTFGLIKMNRKEFPCMRSIGNDVDAIVNEAFLKNLELILNPRTSFTASVKMAVHSGKHIVFTGHSSGGATAILATVWYLETYFKRHPTGPHEPRCITFGAPLVGDYIFKHALGRENWSRFFINFITRFDIVPRITLTQKTSIQETLPHVLEKLDLTRVSIQESDQKITDFYKTVMRETSMVANRAVLTGNEDAFLKNLWSFLEMSPYRPAGTFVFVTEKNLVAVKNSEAILQMLCYSSQSSDAQDWSVVPYQSIRDHYRYEDMVGSMGMKMFNHLEMDHLPLDGENSLGFALNDLGLSTRGRQWIHAALEAEKQKVENQKNVESKRSKIVERLTWIEDDYKPKCQAQKNGYYDSFKASNKENDFKANVTRAELAGIFDEVLGLVKTGQLPDEFEICEDWIRLSTRYRRLIEPLDISNYHRSLKNEDTGPYMIKGRPNRYKHAQRVYEHKILKVTGMLGEDLFWNKVNALNLGTQEDVQEELKKVGSMCGSCFWAEVEELDGKEYQEVVVRIKTLEGLLEGWINEEEVDKDQVLLEESKFTKWWKSLPIEHKLRSPLKECMVENLRQELHELGNGLIV